ncbi:MAG TPA: transposase [Blastocatellia bacterium]|nr:transposase [Blastocatellia bacterium]
MGKTKRGKGTKIMAVADRHGLPVAVCTESASPAEVKLVSQTLEQRFIAEVPARLIGDKAYDSDPLDREMLDQFGIEMIAPHRQGRRLDRHTQDGRALRRFKRRWKVRRLFAWLYNFCRLVVRYEISCGQLPRQSRHRPHLFRVMEELVWHPPVRSYDHFGQIFFAFMLAPPWDTLNITFNSRLSLRISERIAFRSSSCASACFVFIRSIPFGIRMLWSKSFENRGLPETCPRGT